MLSDSAISARAPGQVAAPRQLQRQRLQVDRQLGERARLADEPGLPLVDRDRVLVPRRVPHAADEPTPAQDVLHAAPARAFVAARLRTGIATACPSVIRRARPSSTRSSGSGVRAAAVADLGWRG